MKKIIAAAFAVAALAIPAVASAAPGGMPAAHGVSGAAWGAAVSSLAPGGALGCHASGGMPSRCP